MLHRQVIERYGGFDAGVQCGRVDGHAAPAADSYDPDTLRINFFICHQEIHRRLEILRIDVGRGHVAGMTAALSSEGRIKGDRQEASLRHRLRIQPAGRFHGK